MTSEQRFAVFGAGFWAAFQLAAWQEIPDVRCVTIYNRTRDQAERLAQRFGIPSVHDDARQLLETENIDFVDIITHVSTHSRLVHLAAEFKKPVICQKPLADSLETARGMEAACRRAGFPLLVHENWRWQTPIRALKRILDEGQIGSVFRARIQYANSFSVVQNQPSLKDLEKFILTDMGTHILDSARFLFGEAETLYCQIARIHPDIRGEDVATVMMRMTGGATVVCAMSYASPVEHDRFPETFIFVEGDKGSVELCPDYWIRTTTALGTLAQRCPPPHYPWAESPYELVQASIVPCQADLLGHLRKESSAETTGADNLKTLELVFGAYESARTSEVMQLAKDS
jgi:D-apiose dehydrogenase